MEKLKKIKTKLKGVYIIEPILSDTNSKEFFFQFYNREELKKIKIKNEFKFDTQIKLEKKVLKGLCFQKKYLQSKLIRVTKGKIYQVIVDLRERSKTYGQWEGIELSEENKKILYVPKGFALGYLSLEDGTEIECKDDEEYTLEDVGEIAWNDKDINVAWNFESYGFQEREVIVLKKDEDQLSFKEYTIRQTKEYKIKEKWNYIKKNAERIKTLLEIGAILFAIIITIIIAWESWNFENYYGIPMKYGRSDLLEKSRRTVFLLIMVAIYIWLFLYKIKRENKKIEPIKAFILGMYVGCFNYLIMAETLTYYVSEKIQKYAMTFSGEFYFEIFLSFIGLNAVCFSIIKFESANRILKNIASTIVIIIAILFLSGISKNIVDGYSWKRNYEIIKKDGEVKVVVNIYDGQFVVLEGKIEDENKKLKIIKSKYDFIDKEGMVLEYMFFQKVELIDD